VLVNAAVITAKRNLGLLDPFYRKALVKLVSSIQIGQGIRNTTEKANLQFPARSATSSGLMYPKGFCSYSVLLFTHGEDQQLCPLNPISVALGASVFCF